MNKDFAWLLGYLLSDGYISRPKYRGKGDERHLSFICKYDDREILYKVKTILGTKSNVLEYPQYKSPQARLDVYKVIPLIEEYDDTKTKIPDTIKGFERHFIRGLFDGDGTLSSRVRKGKTKTFRIGFIDEYQHITEWVANTIVDTLMLDKKIPRFVPQSNVWEVMWEGNIARLIAFWLYHGDIKTCCLERKRQKYAIDVLDGVEFSSKISELLYAVKATLVDNTIEFKLPNISTLPWCHRLQNLLPFNTIPVFHNKGRRKYYNLYIPPKSRTANMQDISDDIQSKGIVQ